MGRQAGNADNGIKKTVKTYDKFTKWTGWAAKDIKAHDHELVSINVEGEGILQGEDSQYKYRTAMSIGESVLKIGERHYYVIGGSYKAVDMPAIFKGIKQKSTKVNLRIKAMYTRNCFGDTLRWELYRGEMILIEVNRKHYTSLTEKELTIAADDMYFDGCEVKRNEVITGFVCGIGNGKKTK